MKLTQDDLLILLIEECGEVIQAATKCLRFGFNVDHGTGYGNNRDQLSKETGELLAVIEALPLDQITSVNAQRGKIKRAEVAKELYGRAALEQEGK